MQRVLFFMFFFYSIFCSSFSEVKKIAPNFVFHDPKKTLDRIIELIQNKEKGAYIRFCYDEIKLIHGECDAYQEWNEKLADELREVFSLHGPQVVKALPIHNLELGTYTAGIIDCGLTAHKVGPCLDILTKVKNIWGSDIKNVYSPVALHFAAVTNPVEATRFLKFIKHNNCCIFVGNKNIPRSIIKDFFGRNCEFVKASPENAYREIDRLENDCLDKIPNNSEYKIIVTAVGLAGKLLQKRLWKKLDNVFFIDFGSVMDALSGWKTKKWTSSFNVNRFKERFKKEARIICTAALIDMYSDERKADYIKSLEKISKLGYEPYVVESCKRGPSFLDTYSKYVCYTGVQNNLKSVFLSNGCYCGGVYEVQSLIEGFKHFGFSDDDMIIKLTGRYEFIDDYFIRLVEYNIDADAIVRYWARKDTVFTGCFAMKYKYFKDMLENINLLDMTKKYFSIESIVWSYVNNLKASGGKVFFVDKVNIVANPFWNGTIYNKMKQYW